MCLGTPYRGDDGAGPAVAERLRAAGVPVLEHADEPTRLLDAWAGLDLVVVVDAVRTGADPGTLHRVDCGDGPLPREPVLASSHAMGIGEALALGRALGRAPRRVVLLGVEGVAFGLGEEMTPAVAAVLDAAAAAVAGEIRQEGA